MQQSVFQARGIGKSFPGVKALDGVDLELREGEILALLGENGAGKSTFIKIASGVHQPDQGELYLSGKRVQFNHPSEAKAAGIAVVHQELNVFGELSVAENIMLEDYPRNPLGWIDRAEMSARAVQAMETVGLHINPETRIDDCPVAEKQQVEIARAIYQKARMIILDEPTSSLNDSEVDNLLTKLEALRDTGVAIIYISHKLDEIFRISNRILVLRDGKHISTVETSQTQRSELIRMMVGREVNALYPNKPNFSGESLLEASNLSTDTLSKLTFTVKKGEIFGVYGLMGSGHLDVGKALFGYSKIRSGEIRLDGRVLKLRNPNDAVKANLAYVPSERKTEGLVLSHSLAVNMMVPHYELGGRSLINFANEVATATRWISSLRIKTSGTDVVVGTLSGGNQQKVVLAKWLEVKPVLLILNEPTRGIDVGAKAEIYEIMSRLCQEGVAILMITSEMPELMAMSDRVMVIHDGQASGIFEKTELNETRIISHAIGERHG